MDETDNLLSNQPKGPDGQNDYGTIDEYMNEFSTNKYIRSGFVKKVANLFCLKNRSIQSWGLNCC